MGTVLTSPTKTTARRLRALARLYQQGKSSEIMDRTLEKLFEHEASICRAELSELQADLGAYEQQYNTSSAEFYARYQAGQADDRMDYVEWAALFQMTQNLHERLRLLTGEIEP